MYLPGAMDFSYPSSYPSRLLAGVEIGNAGIWVRATGKRGHLETTPVEVHCEVDTEDVT